MRPRSGARGLTGRAYRGHVFWDADIYVLPFLAATHPAAARAMLEYRIRRLPAALESRASARRRGARFPWESARSGEDVTPRSVRDRSGRVVPIRTGQLEEHIVADVAWAAAQLHRLDRRRRVRRRRRARLLVETARYWASRVELDTDGRGHIYGVIGPDEYHEPRRRQRVHECDGALEPPAAPPSSRAPTAGSTPSRTSAAWLAARRRPRRRLRPHTGVYEQFAGFLDWSRC